MLTPIVRPILFGRLYSHRMFNRSQDCKVLDFGISCLDVLIARVADADSGDVFGFHMGAVGISVHAECSSSGLHRIETWRSPPREVIQIRFACCDTRD